MRGHILNKFTYIKIFKIGRFIKTESKLVVARGWGDEGMGINFLMDKGFNLGVMKNFETR